MDRVSFLCKIFPMLLGVLLACSAGEKTQPEKPQARDAVILKDVPQMIDPQARYLFYLHGQIIEDKGLRPEHPRFGVYEYQAILDSLAARGLVVISEARKPGTNVWTYAQKVTAQVEKLIAAGVTPERITVAGHSKGGAIAIMTSSFLKNDRVNFVFLACCGDWMLERPDVDLTGRILSIYESSDDWAGSCQKALDKAGDDLITREIALQTGLEHGTFYRPLPEWVEPLVMWAREGPSSEIEH